MLFLSQILGAEIIDSADKVIGKVVDLICRSGEDKFPVLTAVLYKEKGAKQLKAFSMKLVENLGKDEVTLGVQAGKVQLYEIHANDFFLARDILDRQIVDLQGTRVVRANDLRFGLVENEYRVLGIDVSTRGLLRRLGVDRWGLFSFFKPIFIDWEKVQMVGKSLKLSTVSEELVKLHPADLANIMEDLNPNQSHRLMQTLDPKIAAKVFEELEPEAKHQILRSLDDQRLTGVLSHVPVDELVDYLKTLHKSDRKKIMASISGKRKKTVQEFLHYGDDTAGGLMTTEFLRAGPNWTIAEAREHVREMSESLRSINFIYVMNDTGELMGIISMRSLIIYPPSEKLRRIMKKVRAHQTVDVDADVDDISKVMTRYNLHTVAVLDDVNKLVGLVTVDDILRQFVPKA